MVYFHSRSLSEVVEKDLLILHLLVIRFWVCLISRYQDMGKQLNNIISIFISHYALGQFKYITKLVCPI